MSIESSLTLPSTLPTNGGFYQRLVLRALQRLPRGRLQLRLPDGSTQTFGRESRSETITTGLGASATIHVRRNAFFQKCALSGDVGFGEAFVDGDWDTPDLTSVIAWFLLNQDSVPTLSGSRVGQAGLNALRWSNRLLHRWRANSRRGSVQNIREHYDLSNDFFSLWLDRTLMYSSARWLRPEWSLEQAQRAKNDALCQKLRLRETDHVLEIGTGWGGWAVHAAERYGCRVTSLTLSRQQYDYAAQRVKNAGLSDRVEVRLQDYRDLPSQAHYDKLVSIEMLEAVGHDYLRDWCRVVSRVLKPQGVMALQFITCPDSRYTSFRRGVDFIQKHVFPGSLLISPNRLNRLLADEGEFMLHGFEDFGPDYARTLRLWREAFVARLPEVRRLGFDERFVRKWTYYLGYCEAAFAMRNISVVHTVHTRPNNLAL